MTTATAITAEKTARAAQADTAARKHPALSTTTMPGRIFGLKRPLSVLVTKNSNAGSRGGRLPTIGVTVSCSDTDAAVCFCAQGTERENAAILPTHTLPVNTHMRA